MIGSIDLIRPFDSIEPIDSIGYARKNTFVPANTQYLLKTLSKSPVPLCNVLSLIQFSKAQPCKPPCFSPANNSTQHTTPHLPEAQNCPRPKVQKLPWTLQRDQMN